MLSIQHSSYLLQGKGVLLDGQRTMDGVWIRLLRRSIGLVEREATADSFPISSAISAT